MGHPSSIEVPEIKEAVAKDGAVRELIRGPAGKLYTHDDQARRTKEVLKAVREDTVKLGKEEKRKALKETRSALLEARESVKMEFQAGAEVKMTELTKRIEALEVETDAEEKKLDEPKKNLEEAANAALKKAEDASGVTLMKTIAIGAGAVAVGVLIKKVWDSIWGSKDKPGGVRKGLGWILGLGAGVLTAVGLSRLLKVNIGVPAIGGKERFGLTDEKYKEAEDLYRNTRGKDANDLKKIQSIFGMKDGEKNEQYDLFIKEMKEKYDGRYENGVQYERIDASIRNCEEQMKIAFSELLEWIKANPILVTGVAYGLNRAGIITIRGILESGKTVATKSAELALELTKLPFKHPFISLFVVGGTVLSIDMARAKGKKTFMPENFSELATAFSKDAKIFIGEATEDMDKKVSGCKDDAKQLLGIGKNFAAWVSNNAMDFGRTFLSKVPELIGATEKEVIKAQNFENIDGLALFLAHRKEQAVQSQSDIDKDLVKKWELAQEKLQKFKEVFLRERVEQTTTNDEPQKSLHELEAALGVAGLDVKIIRKNKLIMWKADGEEWNLCVDPAVTDRKELVDLSASMRLKKQGAGDYIFSRAILELRMKMQENMERGDVGLDVPEGKMIAMVIGELVYFTSWDNLEEFWTAPVTVFQDLVTKDESTSAHAGDIVKAGVGAGLFSLNMAAFARFKRLTIGGGPMVDVVSKRAWKNILGSINPVTSPLRLVRDMGRGIVDFRVFMEMGKFGPEGGRYVNMLLSRAAIRPEWIGMIEHSQDIDELYRISDDMGRSRGAKLSIEEFRKGLKESVLHKLKHEAKMPTWKSLGFKATLVNGTEELYDDVAKWYLTRGKVAKGATWLANAAAHPIRTTVEGIRGVPTTIRSLIFSQADELADAIRNGHKAGDLLKSGKTLDELAMASRKLNDNERLLLVVDLINEKKTTAALLESGFKPSTLLDAGKKPADVCTAVRALKVEAVRAEAMLDLVGSGKATLLQMKTAGIATIELLKAGADGKALIAAGATADDFVRAGKSLKDFELAGGVAADFTKAKEAYVPMNKLLENGSFKKILATAGTVSPADVEACIKLLQDAGHLDAKGLEVIRQSGAAQELLVGAIKTNNPVEVERILKAARGSWAVKFRIFGNALGGGLDIMSICMAISDYFDNGAKLDQAKKTGNLALQEVYKDAQNINLVEGAVSTATLVIGGYAVITTGVATGSVTMGLAAPGAMIVLPVAIIVGTTVYGAKKLNKMTEELSMTEDDWRKKNPSELLQALNKRSNFQTGLSGTLARTFKAFQYSVPGWEHLGRKLFTNDADYQEWMRKGNELVDGAESGERSRICFAYLSNTTAIPKGPGESDDAYKTRFGTYLLDSMIFLSRFSGGTYSFGGNKHDQFELARQHAELMATSRRLQKEGRSQEVQLYAFNTGKKGRTFDLAKYSEAFNKNDLGVIGGYMGAKRAEIFDGINEANRAAGTRPEIKKYVRSMIANTIVNETKDDIRNLEAKLLEHSFGTITEGENDKALARYSASRFIRERMFTQTDSLLAAPSITAEAFTASVANVEEICRWQPTALLSHGKERGFTHGNVNTKMSSYLLDPNWISGHLKPEDISIE